MSFFEGSPLPIPRWGEARPSLSLTMEEYLKLTTQAEAILKNILREQNYDSVHCLLHFYRSYKSKNVSFFELFRRYVPRIYKNKLTCVGLALELVAKWHVLDKEFPDFAKFSFIVSCDQAVEDIQGYVAYDSPEDKRKVDKEHALVCVKIFVDGRPGVLLADPGYHVGSLITVMYDKKKPHSDSLIQTNVPECRKQFRYFFNSSNSDYVEWHEEKTTFCNIYTDIALIYIARPYLDGVSVTTRRNLVYEFRSILARNGNGQLTAGMYFKARPNEDQFTLLIHDEEGRKKTKYYFSLFQGDYVLPESLDQDLTTVNSVLGLKDGELTQLLKRIAEMLDDDEFLANMLQMNDYIRNYVPPIGGLVEEENFTDEEETE